MKKKLENIWYYYKIPIIIVIAVLALFVYTLKEKLSEEKYDHNIAIISKYNYPSEENVYKLKEIFENKVGGSFNINIYNVALGEIGEDEIVISKLGVDIANKISEYYFIEDMEAFKKATSNVEFIEVSLVNDVDYLNNLGLNNFYFCIRR